MTDRYVPPTIARHALSPWDEVVRGRDLAAGDVLAVDLGGDDPTPVVVLAVRRTHTTRLAVRGIADGDVVARDYSVYPDEPVAVLADDPSGPYVVRWSVDDPAPGAPDYVEVEHDTLRAALVEVDSEPLGDYVEVRNGEETLLLAGRVGDVRRHGAVAGLAPMEVGR